MSQEQAFGRDRVLDLACPCIWKYFLSHGQLGRASGVLLQMAERSDSSCGLHERLGYLNSAQTHLETLEEPPDDSEQTHIETIREVLSLRVEVASSVQKPLYQELHMLLREPLAVNDTCLLG